MNRNIQGASCARGHGNTVVISGANLSGVAVPSKSSSDSVRMLFKNHRLVWSNRGPVPRNMVPMLSGSSGMLVAFLYVIEDGGIGVRFEDLLG